ncbi:MAG: PEGA domain-containing protein [Kofleriaceae bacterium]
MWVVWSGEVEARGKGAAPALLKQAQSAYARGNPAEALEIVEAILNGTPTDLPALDLKCSVLLALEDYEGALEANEAFLAAGATGGKRRQAERMIAKLIVLRTTNLDVNVSNGPATLRIRRTAVVRPFCVASPSCSRHALPGGYEVMAERPGFQPWSQRVQVKANTTTQVDLTLVELPSRLRVDVAVANASVTVDDAPYEGPIEVTPGPHRVAVKAPGRVDTDVEVVAREGKPIDLKLDPNRRAQLRVAPQGATVLLDGQPVEVKDESIELSPGPHELVVKAEGYQPRTVKLPADELSGPVELALAEIVVLPPPPGMTTRRKLALGAGGVAAAAMIGGLALGASSGKLEDQSYSVCPVVNDCDDPTRANSLHDKSERRALQANISFGIAGAAAAAAAALWFTGGRESAVTVTPRMEPGAAASAGVDVAVRF